MDIKEVSHEERLQAQREYMKIWRANNKEKCKTYREKYWSKVAATTKE